MTAGEEKDVSLAGLIHLWVVYVVWGSTYLAIRFGVREGSGFPPFTFGAVRVLTAGGLLLLIARLRGRNIVPQKGEWWTLVGSGLLLWIGGNGLVLWAEQDIDSGIAALIVASVPIWVAGMEAILDRRLPSYRLILSLVVGFSGIVVLSAPVWSSGIRANVMGILALFAASISWGGGMILQSRRPVKLKNSVSSAYQQLAGGAAFLGLAFLLGEPRPTPSGQAWLALGYLIVFGSLIAFTSFVSALQLLPTRIVITYSYVNPLIAVVLGRLFLQEPITVWTVLGAALVLIGVYGVFRNREERRTADSPPEGHSTSSRL